MRRDGKSGRNRHPRACAEDLPTSTKSIGCRSSGQARGCRRWALRRSSSSRQISFSRNDVKIAEKHTKWSRINSLRLLRKSKPDSSGPDPRIHNRLISLMAMDPRLKAEDDSSGFWQWCHTSNASTPPAPQNHDPRSPQRPHPINPLDTHVKKSRWRSTLQMNNILPLFGGKSCPLCRAKQPVGQCRG